MKQNMVTALLDLCQTMLLHVNEHVSYIGEGDYV
jgi:hypothetical protein